MKNSFYLTLCLLFVFTFKLLAQTDSFEVKENKFMRTYNYLTMAKKEETSVWKLKVLPINFENLPRDPFSYEGMPIIVSYERKITPRFSWQVEMKAIYYEAKNFYNGYPSRDLNYQTDDNKTMILNTAVAAEFRYYYNMKARMHRKHLSNNFSANYIATRVSTNVLQTGTLLQDMLYQYEDPLSDLAKGKYFDNHVDVYYGIQRRFLGCFFFDAHFGVMCRYSEQPFQVNTYSDNNGGTFKRIERAPRLMPLLNFRWGLAF